MPYTLIAALLLAASDTADTTKRWEAYVTAASERFARGTESWLPWELQTAGLRRHGKALSIDVAGFSSQRFGLRDNGGTAEVTRVLWGGAYGSARIQAAPNARAIARVDAAVDLYQGVGHGWEAIAGGRVMRFEDANVGVYSGGMAKYVGDWYLRGRASVAPMRGELGVGGALTARRYFGNATELLEVSAAAGREVVTLAPPNVELRRTMSVTMRGQHVLAGSFGVTGALSLSEDDGLPTRKGFMVGVFGRW